MTLQGKVAKDRRIQKTQNLLHEALASLIRGKPSDSIVVKEILARANVGRSTFYTHLRDKDDLLVKYIASTFILVLNWWVESKSPLPPKEVNDLFRALILTTLAATLE